jgi:PIN domain nuclease of toxin-antitoxin system
MRVLLDTVTFVFAIQSSERLSAEAKAVLEDSRNVRELSVLSLAEIGLKNAIGKLALSPESTMSAAERLRVQILGYLPEHAFRLFDLPLHHKDPFDRQLIAQALAENIPVVTCDERFALYKGLRVIW